mgnify:FL=1
MRRLSETFQKVSASKKPGLVAYITAGDPNLERSADILQALDKAGADVLEVGAPFSDPLADGPIIQRASERALASGTTLSKVLDMVAQVRKKISAPIVIFSYANPILRMGEGPFVTAAKRAGVDGVLILDLPIEEAAQFRKRLEEQAIDMIFLLSPTTTEDRIKKAASLGSGFLYVISRLGVTGIQEELAGGIEGMITRVRKVSKLPIALGFGISKPEHVSEVGRWADAAVVGSSLVKIIAEVGDSEKLVDRVQEHVRWLKAL